MGDDAQRIRLVWSRGRRTASAHSGDLNTFQLLGEQELRRHLSVGGPMDEREVFCRDGLAPGPLRDPALGDAASSGELVLGAELVDCLLYSAHAGDISRAYAKRQQPGLWRSRKRSISLPNMSTGQRKKVRNITPADLEAAKRLRIAWAKAAKAKTLRQEDFPELGSQSLISQYLNGKIALNYYAVTVFASRLGCRPEDIRSDLPEQQLQQGSSDHDLDRLWATYTREEKLLAIGLQKAFRQQIQAPPQPALPAPVRKQKRD